MTDIVFKEESFKIIGACMKVHASLGSGFLEAVYHEALERELKEQKIPFTSKVKLAVFYNAQKLKKYYVADLVCFDEIILELKVQQLTPKAHYLQLRNYLKATGKRLGILINFGTPSLSYKRILNPQSTSHNSP
jgi:GxxExxY protein